MSGPRGLDEPVLGFLCFSLERKVNQHDLDGAALAFPFFPWKGGSGPRGLDEPVLAFSCFFVVSPWKGVSSPRGLDGSVLAFSCFFFVSPWKGCQAHVVPMGLCLFFLFFH